MVNFGVFCIHAFPYLSKSACLCSEQVHSILSKSELLNIMATKRSQKCQSCSSRVFSCGTILVLASNTLLYAAYEFVYNSIRLSLPDYLRVGFHCAHYALWVLLPVTGWVAESWLGRYRAIVVGLIICIITLFLLQVAFIMLNLDWTPIPAFVLAIGSLAFGTCGIGGFYTSMLPFTLDQMIGASAEDLSAAIQWYLWGYFGGMLALKMCRCIPLAVI